MNELASEPLRVTEPILDGPTRQLCDAVADGELAPVRLAIMAPGGYGKTTVLNHLARRCAEAASPVVQSVAEITEPVTMLVDDAHLLGPDSLGELRRHANDERVGLVIAARPWPRPVGLNEVLGQLRGQVVLRPFDHGRIRTYLAAAGGRPSAELVEFVHTQTGGVPGFVHRVAGVLDGSTTELPAAALAEFRHEFDRVTPDLMRFLLAADAGVGLDLDLLRELLDRDADGVGEVIEAARATGLLGLDGAMLPIGSRALRAVVPVETRIAIRQRLAELQLARGGPVLALVRPLVGTGIGGPAIAAAFEAAARQALPGDPALAARLFEAAVTAGRPVAAVGARWAEAAALSGDLDAALRLADQVIATVDAADRAKGARVAATALAHRGQLARSAELHAWAGGRLGTAFAAIGLVGTGRLAEAQELLQQPDDGPPTVLLGAMSSTARGTIESVSGSPTVALSTLVSSAEMLVPVGRAVLLPDSPAALGALVAMHCGEPAIAEPLLERAVAAETGAAALAPRHRLLLAWLAMARGDLARAAAERKAAGTSLAPRDWLFAVGLEVGLARRTSDLGALRQIWDQAAEVVIRHPVDLFTLLPFGELAVAAARLGDQDRLAPHLHQARELLRGLGDPPLWATPLHWSGLHAAIIAERPADAEDHVAAMAANARHGAYYAVMSAAADCWLKVLGGEIDQEEVETAARGLHGVGLCWDAARLAGQAAIRTSDRKAMVALLDCARVLQGKVEVQHENQVRLSERELQVAELVLAGLTYRQVGDRLFISAKTVEHHMARMRQRLAATSRSELLSQLRTVLADRSST